MVFMIALSITVMFATYYLLRQFFNNDLEDTDDEPSYPYCEKGCGHWILAHDPSGCNRVLLSGKSCPCKAFLGRLNVTCD